MQKITDSKKKYYKATMASLVSLSIPTVLEEILATLLQYVDTAMVGHLGEDATAAVSATTTIGWLMHAIPGAFAVAMLALAARANGAGDERLLRKIAGQAMICAFSIGIVLEIAALALSPYIPIWMGVEEDIVGPASMYFFITSLTLVFRTSSRVFSAMLRSVKDTKSPMYVSICENILNVVLNYILIYECNLGIFGAAVASSISFCLGGLAMFILMLSKTGLRPGVGDLKLDRAIMAEALSIGMPVLGTTVVSCLGYIVFAGMVSRMGTTVFAAHSIAITAEQIVYIPGYGVRVATSSLIGNILGKGNLARLRVTSRAAIFLIMAMMLVNGTLLYLFAHPFMQIFTNSAEVAELGGRMLKLVAFSEPFFGLMIVLEGISYGMGRTKHIFLCESASMWGVRILMTFICINVWGLGLEAVWFCMIADNIAKSLLLYIFRPRV